MYAHETDNDARFSGAIMIKKKAEITANYIKLYRNTGLSKSHDNHAEEHPRRYHPMLNIVYLFSTPQSTRRH